MSKNPLISIITVNLNDVRGLDRTLRSVLSQTWQEFEYIVIDGGSSDGSRELIETYDNRISEWLSEPDSGIYNAMNKGIKMANGSYFLFLNSGDELFNSTVLEENLEHFQSFDIIYFDILLVFNNETKVHKYPPILNFSTFRNGAIGHPTSFIKRDLFSSVGYYDENLKIVADWKFYFYAVVKYNCSYKKVNTVLSKFYMDGISSTNLKLLEKERKMVLREEFFAHFNNAKKKTLLDHLVINSKKILKIFSRTI
ncbi:glycosyltransferase family 2 protein [Christiangramia echinicola]|uniref:glycosyltransferase family 2 protein n=1 Tax=Christiangramia echinicola TaxID=279359 RepID=UPI000407FD79|nr:glycosyltransferase family 2 protein [Christiangramia echinicola]